MVRYLIFDPRTNSFVKISKGGWTCGHPAEVVNSYGSMSEATHDMQQFDSLSKCRIVKVEKTVKVLA